MGYPRCTYFKHSVGSLHLPSRYLAVTMASPPCIGLQALKCQAESQHFSLDRCLTLASYCLIGNHVGYRSLKMLCVVQILDLFKFQNDLVLLAVKSNKQPQCSQSLLQCLVSICFALLSPHTRNLFRCIFLYCQTVALWFSFGGGT